MCIRGIIILETPVCCKLTKLNESKFLTLAVVRAYNDDTHEMNPFDLVLILLSAHPDKDVVSVFITRLVNQCFFLKPYFYQPTRQRV